MQQTSSPSHIRKNHYTKMKSQYSVDRPNHWGWHHKKFYLLRYSLYRWCPKGPKHTCRRNTRWRTPYRRFSNLHIRLYAKPQRNKQTFRHPPIRIGAPFRAGVPQNKIKVSYEIFMRDASVAYILRNGRFSKLGFRLLDAVCSILRKWTVESFFQRSAERKVIQLQGIPFYSLPLFL